MGKETCWICGYEISDDSKYTCDNCGDSFHKGCIEKMSYCINCGMPSLQTRETNRAAAENAYRERNVRNTQKLQNNIIQQNTNQSHNAPEKSVQNQHDTGFIYGMNILNSDNDVGPYANIGGKIKGLAKATAIGGLILGVLVFIFAIIIEEEAWWLGLIIGVAIAVVYWISSFTLYGYGELISSSCEQSKILTKILNEIKRKG